jgi:hypothetical protein
MTLTRQANDRRRGVATPLSSASWALGMRTFDQTLPGIVDFAANRLLSKPFLAEDSVAGGPRCSVQTIVAIAFNEACDVEQPGLHRERHGRGDACACDRTAFFDEGHRRGTRLGLSMVQGLSWLVEQLDHSATPMSR